MYEIKAYRCSYCKKYGLSKSNIKKHEEGCFRNPLTRSCVTCANYAQKDNGHPSQFHFDTTPICLENILLVQPTSFMDDEPKYNLKTACKKWVERPEDEVELTQYQIEKQRFELIVLKPERP